VEMKRRNIKKENETGNQKSKSMCYMSCYNDTHLTSLKPGLDGARLGSFYVITDVTDKESYSNAPCNRPGAALSVIGGARLVGSPQKRFSHEPQRDSARAAVAATRRLQSTRQASLVQPVYT
jgi:hypothetical protein